MKKRPFKAWVFLLLILPFIAPNKAKCQYLLELADTLTGTQDYNACKINSSQVLEDGSASVYTATDEIIMGSGFFAKDGAEFFATFNGTCASSVVWEDIPANVIVDHETNSYQKAYANPIIGLRSCNVLPSGPDGGFVEFTLLDDVQSNDDWLYIGLIEDTTALQGLEIEDANFLIGVRANSFLQSQENNVFVLEKGDNKGSNVDGGILGDVFKIERTGDTIKYWRNNSLIYTRDPSTSPGPLPSTLNLQTIYYVFQTGSDLQNNLEVVTSFDCDNLHIRYVKQDAPQDSIGSIELIPQGGYPPYSVFWENQEYDGLFLDSLAAGSYKVSVIDVQGNQASEEIRLNELSNASWDSIGINISISDNYYIANPASTDITRVLLGDQVIPASGNGKISFTIRDSVGTDYSTRFIVGFRNIDHTNDASGFFGIELNGDSMVAHVSPYQVTIADITLIEPIDFSRNYKDYLYEIELQNGDFVFWKNGKEVFRDSVPSNLNLLRMDAAFLKTDQVDGMPVDIKVSFPPLPPVAVYAELQKMLDGSYVIVKDKKLRFKYIEDYQVVGGINDILDYTIYDWTKTVPPGLGSISPANVKHGINWLTINTGSLAHENFYTLEVTDSKGGKSYLRFQYQCPGNLPCAEIYVDDE